jgi:hypothetical protein
VDLSVTYTWLMGNGKVMAMPPECSRFNTVCNQIVYNKAESAFAEFYYMSLWTLVGNNNFRRCVTRMYPELLFYEITRLCAVHAELVFVALAGCISNQLRSNSLVPADVVVAVEDLLAQYVDYVDEPASAKASAAYVNSCVFKVFDKLRGIPGAAQYTDGVLKSIRADSDGFSKYIATAKNHLCMGRAIAGFQPFVNFRAMTRVTHCFQQLASVNFQMYKPRYMEMISDIATKIVAAHDSSSDPAEIAKALSNMQYPDDHVYTAKYIHHFYQHPKLPPVRIIKGVAKFWERNRGKTFKRQYQNDVEPFVPTPEEDPLVNGIAPAASTTSSASATGVEAV